MTGVILRILKDKGFGFLQGDAQMEKGVERFFHRSGVPGGQFDSLHEGMRVSFDEEVSPKGPRATNVKPTSQME